MTEITQNLFIDYKIHKTIAKILSKLMDFKLTSRSFCETHIKITPHTDGNHHGSSVIQVLKCLNAVNLKIIN